MEDGMARPRIRWHVVYYLLAAFDVLTVTASLELSRRVLGIYMRSVAQSQEWAGHMEAYSNLQRMAAEVNAPGNDVFDSQDVAAEAARMRTARAAFTQRLDALRQHLATAHPAEAGPLLERFAAVERTMDEMAREAEVTFAELTAGAPTRAARRMAAMDRSYARVISALQDLQGNVAVVQQRIFAEQTAAARRLQRYELVIAGLIVLMVGAALAYGRRIERESGREAAARERYLQGLKTAEESLRRAHGDLEARMEERTKALRESEAALRQAASEWRRTFDAIDSLVMILDLRGRLVRANATVRGLLGMGAADQVTGRIVTALGKGEPWDTAARLAQEAREAGGPVSTEAHDRPAGRSFEVSAYLAEAGEGDEARIIVVAKDTTRILELRETLRREENMAAMGALVAGVAHEVRNPIFAISSTLDAFEARFGQTPGLEKYFPVLRREVTRLGRLMEDLLDYGRPPRMEAVAGSLRSVVAEAMRASEAGAAAAGVVVVDRVPPDLPDLVLDTARMGQVFRNVIDNAVQHTPRGGRVVVEARLKEGEPRPCVEATVRDSGPGFRPEDLPQVFRPLFTRRPGGTGLGLAIAERIVEMHGGTMAAANHPDGGAVVTVRLPVEAAPADRARALA
jgi:PAS domain S-box-containing protein